MLKLSEVRNPLIKGLHTFTGVPVIMGNQTGEAPPYPYLAINFTELGNAVGQIAEKVNGSEMTFIQQNELTVSISAYSDKLDASFELAYQALEWFKGMGVLDLQDANIAVIRTRPIVNRDTFLTIEYERRHGFDVNLRVATESAYDVGFIEEVKLDVED